MQKQLILTAFILTITGLMLTVTGAGCSLAFAATPKPSSSPTATARPQPSSSPLPSSTLEPKPSVAPAGLVHETTTKLRERLQKILGDQDENGQIKKKAAYIGQITRVNEEAISLKTLDGSEIIPLDTSIILLKRSQRIPVAEVTVGNWLIVIGYREKNQSIKPELLLVQTSDLRPREHLAAIGVITSTSNTSVSLTPRGKSEPVEFKLTKNSKLLDATGEVISMKNVPKDVAVVVVGFATDKGWELGTLKTLVALAELKTTPKP